MAEAKITKQQRDKIEDLVYRVFDAVDKTHTNSDYYRKIFSDMTDDQFYKFLQRRLPFRFHTEVFKIEPKMYEVFDAFKILDKPYWRKYICLMYILMLRVKQYKLKNVL